MDRLVIGCGYVGERIAKIWRSAGDEVVVTTRSVEKAVDLAGKGLKPLVWDWQGNLPPRELALRDGKIYLQVLDPTNFDLTDLKTVLIAVSHASAAAIPPTSSSDHALNASPSQNSHPAGLQKVFEWLESLRASSSTRSDEKKRARNVAEREAHAFPRWIYLSTTGVLNPLGALSTAAGPNGGNEVSGRSNLTLPSTHLQKVDHTPGDEGLRVDAETSQWLDEDSPLGPTRPGAKNAAEGEKWIRSELNPHNRLILRPTGIYGEERVPNWRAIRDQVPLEVAPESFLNLVHVDDLVSVIRYFSDTKPNHEVYCVGDNHPVRRSDYYDCIAELGGFPPPKYRSKETDEQVSQSGVPAQTKSRSSSDKRISSQRLHDELPFPFQFPTYREGLKALLADCMKSLKSQS